MKVLSLFDGMACGMLAMKTAGIEVDKYTAFEVDKYAIETAQHNFPIIEERGDVFKADFTEFKGVDFLIGGSPCTYWSIAQTKNRETVASGMGWELFSQYVRALREAEPRYFLYENNKSMSASIRASITETFGFEPILINSALVSAQNRQRLYWCGIRQADGSYKKAGIDQPADRGILLKDILETRDNETKQLLSEREMDYMTRDHLEHRWAHCNKPGQENKSKCIVVNISKGVPHNILAEPVCVAQRGRYDENGKVYQHYEAQPNGKTNNLTTVQKDNLIAEPIKLGEIGNGGQGNRVYSVEGKAVAQTAQSGGMGSNTGLYAIPAEPLPVMKYELESVNNTDAGIVGILDMKGQDIIRRVYGTNGKSPTLTTCAGGHREPKIIEPTENKNQSCPVYEVKNGYITVKDKSYPIKLADGFYIIRKLTVTECKRLQTVPDSYDFPVSKSQAYKMLGNGWTVEVIAHLLRGLVNGGGTV